ncbi:MAG: 50S ribosomal protein L30 [Anaerolineae bacterium]|nr:50S ribosomal protein L30 [Anaerolineae bacterium]
MTKMLRVKYIKSQIGYPQPQKDTLRALKLKRLGDIVKVKDTDVIRGMLRKVGHLVQIEEVE